jgi:hypothetical protein
MQFISYFKSILFIKTTSKQLDMPQFEQFPTFSAVSATQKIESCRDTFVYFVRIHQYFYRFIWRLTSLCVPVSVQEESEVSK